MKRYVKIKYQGHRLEITNKAYKQIWNEIYLLIIRPIQRIKSILCTEQISSNIIINHRPIL